MKNKNKCTTNTTKRFPWHKKIMSWREKHLIRFMKDTAQEYGLRLIFRYRQSPGGTWDKNNKLITLSSDWKYRRTTISDIISIFFHELAHQVNWQEGRYWVYHHDGYENDLRFKLTAWKAERYTDKIGRLLMKSYVPGIRYRPAYCKSDKTWFRKWWGWTTEEAFDRAITDSN